MFIGILVSGFLNLALAEINLVSASAEDIATLDNINEAEAKSIVEYRASHNGIPNIEALRVLNLSESSLDTLRQEAILTLQISKTSTKKFNSVEAVMSEFETEPDIRAVQSMAMQYSKTNPELMEKWLSASKRAYALPKVNLQYEKQLDEATRYDYVAGVDGGLESQEDYIQLGNDDKVVVRLEWRLDKLVMSSEQIRVINETGKANKMREKVLDEVTRLYFDRRRLQVDNLLDPPSSLSDRIEMELRLQEMTANLDALTGGQFSASI
jgi:hypothetical protein